MAPAKMILPIIETRIEKHNYLAGPGIHAWVRACL